eukprot:750013_1
MPRTSTLRPTPPRASRATTPQAASHDAVNLDAEDIDTAILVAEDVHVAKDAAYVEGDITTDCGAKAKGVGAEGYRPTPWTTRWMSTPRTSTPRTSTSLISTPLTYTSRAMTLKSSRAMTPRSTASRALTPRAMTPTTMTPRTLTVDGGVVAHRYC